MKKTTVETEICVCHTIKAHSFESTLKYRLTKPYLPDGCEHCGAYKGSCFELKLMNLIPYERISPEWKRFLCEKCFVEAHDQDPQYNYPGDYRTD
jgi:hypothetical protein